MLVASRPVPPKTSLPKRPRLSGESLARVEDIERSVENALAERVRVYTSVNPGFFPSVANIQSGGHRVIDLICGYAEASIDAHAAEYQRTGLEEVPAIVQAHIIPEIRNRAQSRWAAWLVGVGIARAGHVAKVTTDQTGGPKVRARFSRRRADPDLVAKLRELGARFDEQLETALSANGSHPCQEQPLHRGSDDQRQVATRQYLRRQMKAKGWSALDLAKHAGLDFKTVKAYLDGKRSPYNSTLQRMASALGLKIEDLS